MDEETGMNDVVTQDRLYQELARQLIEELASGKYAVGDRLPAERELSVAHAVSRPTVREAIIALEVQGLVEVRVGSGAYVKRLPGRDDVPGFGISAFELTEARMMFEAEAAALAASQISDEELQLLDSLVVAIAAENQEDGGDARADREFHLTIAKAGRNTAVYNVIEELWNLRARSPESALLHAKARTANVKPVVAEHQAIVDALRTRNPATARAAMRAHLGAVLDHLLFTTEEQAIEAARQEVALKRQRYARSSG